MLLPEGAAPAGRSASARPPRLHRIRHAGKVGVLALAPEPGLGVRDGELRARHLPAINRFRTPPA
ncbi:hypothetical protein [Streptomyces longwoodensis]|uniref:hypothetical protein n=1 Tax=Streptomyces longwoodensis TaxID=68231 RepID=UPI00382F8DA0